MSPAGGKWWRLKYRYGNKEKLLSLGVYPDVSLKDARTRRDELRTVRGNGIDPGIHRNDSTAKRRISRGCQRLPLSTELKRSASLRCSRMATRLAVLV